MGLANRRRIWEACESLAVDYQRILGTWKIAVPDSEEANAILEASVCLQMPAVIEPQPKAANTVAAQFVDSWTDLENRACRLDTYWNPSQILTGISLSFGDEKRVFGLAEGEKGCEVKMAPGEWIREIRVGTLAVDFPGEVEEDRPARQSAVTHLVVRSIDKAYSPFDH